MIKGAIYPGAIPRPRSFPTRPHKLNLSQETAPLMLVCNGISLYFWGCLYGTCNSSYECNCLPGWQVNKCKKKNVWSNQKPEMVFEWINVHKLPVQNIKKSAEVSYFLTRPVTVRMGLKGLGQRYSKYFLKTHNIQYTTCRYFLYTRYPLIVFGNLWKKSKSKLLVSPIK